MLKPSDRAWIACCVFGAAILALPLFVHTDDGDAQLYRVVVRHMVADGTWTQLRYEPNAHAAFREHLPFGLWPYAAVARVAGEGAIPWLGWLFGVAALAFSAWIGERLVGPWAGSIAALTLATCDSFFSIAGESRLEGELVLFATVASAPVLLGRLGVRAWFLAGAFAAAAVAVKGPFGLVPLTAACLAQGITGRWRSLLPGALTVVLAAAPVAAFLLHDRLDGHTWWTGYVENQLLASATGARSDGSVSLWVPWKTLLFRFWPGLPLVVLGTVAAVGARWVSPERRQVARLLAVFDAAMLVLLSLPSRKLWYHGLVAFPGLAWLGAAGAQPWLERWISRGSRVRWATTVLSATAAVAWLLLFTGLPARVAKPPLVFCGEFGPLASAHPAGTPALVIGSAPWKAVAIYAEERDWSVFVELNDQPGIASALAGKPEYATARVLVVDEASLGAVPPPGWTAKAHARGWWFFERSGPG